VTWPVERISSGAAELHRRELPEPARRAVWVGELTSVALVLGSAQGDDVVDAGACRAAGVEVVRRRSGGGAVLLVPGEVLWVDIVLPAGDPLWQVDVGRAFHWLGDAWAAALGDVGVTAQVHRRGLEAGPWSHLVCFAGLGPGEVTSPAGQKLVGIAQRRTRAAARFQCAVLAAWRPDRILDLLALPPEQRAVAGRDLAGAATGIGAHTLDPLLDALLRALP
jgi:lipoate---protein ligase